MPARRGAGVNVPTVADLQRRSPRSLRLFLDRQGLRGGPFREVFDPDEILVLPIGALASGRVLARAQQPVGRLILRQGVIDDRFLRAWICGDDSASGGEFLELSLEDADDEVRARWYLDDVRVLEVADRRRRDEDDPRFDYLLLQVRLVGLSGGDRLDL
ncbi:MAG: hypothetical protein R3B09_15850 [Nannocystaceae bacterium]